MIIYEGIVHVLNGQRHEIFNPPFAKRILNEVF